MTTELARIGNKVIRPHKAVLAAQFEIRNVLTADPFDYVDLWLRRQNLKDALFYWRQARMFYRASRDLPIESSPLVLYYSFMNAAKALLSAKGITFAPNHGVKAHSMRGANAGVVLSNEGIKIKGAGVVPALASYFAEGEPARVHSFEDVLYNLVYIHRTYCLSFPGAQDRFLPLANVGFWHDDTAGEVFFQANPVSDADLTAAMPRLPHEMQLNPTASSTLVSTFRARMRTNGTPNPQEITQLQDLNSTIRHSLFYINGSQTLWYLKLADSRNIDRQSITLTLSAMHRLSEICRYRPSELDAFLNGQENWLLSEFVAMSPAQFLDEIACEMTGQQIMIPNVRIPT